MGKLYILMGKSASGKDTLYHQIMKCHPELLPVVPYTTRPLRAGEKEGREYHFVTEEEFRKFESRGKVAEYRCYETVMGPWYYFTADDGQIDFSCGDYCLISTLEGYGGLRDYFGEEYVIPLYIEVPDMVRIQRSLAREGQQKKPCVAEVCRRFLADEEDFSEDKLIEAGITNRIVNEDMGDALAQINGILNHDIRKQ